MQRHQRTEEKVQGTNISHSYKFDKAIVFYELLKRPAQGARKQEIHIFVEDFAAPRNAQIADFARKKVIRASKGAVATNKMPKIAFLPSFWGSKKWLIWCKMLKHDIENHVSCLSGVHFSRKGRKFRSKRVSRAWPAQIEQTMTHEVYAREQP